LEIIVFGIQLQPFRGTKLFFHRISSFRVKRNFFSQQEIFRLTRSEGVWQSSRPFADVGSLTTE